MSLRPIDSVDELHRYLQAALQLEHATIPPYLTALYSLHPVTNQEAARVLRVVAVEEMLHLTLVANVMNAVGCTPDLTGADFTPAYPAHLPDGETDFEVGICGFTRDALDTFMHIERPADSGGTTHVERDRSARALLPVVDTAGAEMHFFSIGEFYAEIIRGMHALDAEMRARGEDLFCGDPSHQVTPELYYSGGGEVIPVKDLHSAIAALELISEQGEGIHGDLWSHEGELSHYFRFEQLVAGRRYQPGDVAGAPTGEAFAVDWGAVYPVKPDATLEDYPAGSDLRAAVLEFNAEYQRFLARLTDAFAGRPDLLVPAVGDMFRLKDLAAQILRSPIPGQEHLHAAPIYGVIPAAPPEGSAP